MGDLAFRVKNLSKQYQIGERKGYDYRNRYDYKTLRDILSDATGAPLRAAAGILRGKNPQSVQLQRKPSSNGFIWSLKDVSFEVKRGEVVGIIGRNGAGKTTLLKILSRITEPTEGYAEVHGRVGALLEVGTGFHPELTGRENVYLNGALLGMKRAEIRRKFDEIVAFAEVERFLDTPVKRYSNGMYLRLAFAVAAHLEPEILLVDEVLAVGDYEFQKKCLGKMGQIQQEGRTVLLVSHSMSSILNLCQRAILLDAGRVVKDGKAADVIEHYVATTRTAGGEVVWPDPAAAPGNEKVRLHSVRILSEEGKPTADVDIQKDVSIEITFWNFKEGAKLYAAIHLKDQVGGWVLASSNMTSANLTPDPWFDRPHPTGLFRSVCRLPGNFLNDILYSVNAIVGTNVNHTEVCVKDVLSFRVYDTGAMGKECGASWTGVPIRPKLAWSVERLETSKREVTLS